MSLDEIDPESWGKEVKKSPPIDHSRNTTRKTNTSRLDAFETRLTEIETLVRRVVSQHQSDLPEEIRSELIILFNEQQKRFTKWRYGEYLKRLTKVAEFFQITLT